MRKDPLFKGCTRPAMFFGVPIVPLSVAVGAVFLLAVWISLFVAVTLIPIVLVMRMITKTDDQQFRLLSRKLYCRLLPHMNKNAKFWGSSTYAPIVFKHRR